MDIWLVVIEDQIHREQLIRYITTDVTICRGDQLDRAYHTLMETGDFNGYVYGTQNSYGGSGQAVSAINLHTGTNRCSS